MMGWLSSFFGNETKAEKEQRIKSGRLENELARKEAEAKGEVYFGWRYEDDYGQEL